MPSTPSSPSLGHSSRGKALVLSSSAAIGAILSLVNPRTLWRSCSAVSPRSKLRVGKSLGIIEPLVPGADQGRSWVWLAAPRRPRKLAMTEQGASPGLYRRPRPSFVGNACALGAAIAALGAAGNCASRSPKAPAARCRAAFSTFAAAPNRFEERPLAPSFRRGDLCLLHHLGPARHIVGDELRKLGRRAAARGEPLYGQGIAHLGRF